MIEKAKEAIEENLLGVLRNIDSAKFIINSNESYEGEYNTEFNELVQAKALVKKALNRSFDYCARNRTEQTES